MSTLNLSKKDLTPFTDLGAMIEENTSSGFLLTRNGAQIMIKPHGAGYVLTSSDDDGAAQHYPDAGALLASATFANLSRVAKNQAIVLTSQRINGDPVPITYTEEGIIGEIPKLTSQNEPWRSLDLWLRDLNQTRNPEGTDLLLINGPAGVGKTTIVREAALLRAENFDGSAPLILQISSRGRVLQNIADLIAFTLQDVRSNLTIGQLMSLMRHGLVTLAIDGFDELSDPNGFETAWSGLNNLVSEARGAATFLLAGRETFVSTDTILKQLKYFETSRDRLALLSLKDPTPDLAREWLLNKSGWSRDILRGDFVEPIFVRDSYALRPFFLDVISREPKALQNDTPPASDLLSYLVDVMTQREAKKFVETFDPPDGSEAENAYAVYVGRFLEEVARDLAENQSESLADEALDLIATVAADGLLPEDQVPAVIQRARTMVFLANDQRVGHVRFAHEQLLQHFLAREALRSVGEGEIPRYVRRNLFGHEALKIFAHVARGRVEEVDRFLSAVRAGTARPSRDRTNTNLSVLGVAVACAVSEKADLQIKDVGINELCFPFAAPDGIVIQDTTISILYAASADLRQVVFESGVHISTLEIDRWTRLPASRPLPQTLVHPDGTTADKQEIRNILGSTEGNNGATFEFNWPDGLSELLGRIERYRAFWLRTNDNSRDQQGRRITTHPDWPAVYEALQKLDLVTIKSRQASGTRSEFVHFRQDAILTEHLELYRELTG